MFKIFNTLSGKKEALKPAKKQLRIFVCGPTVYDYSHLGHARTYVFFDFFVKYLRSLGCNVFYLQNITDIDDRIIARAQKEKKTPLAIAGFYAKAYLADMKKLGVDAVTKYAPATKFIPQIISQVNRLIEKDCAYEIPGDGYYFDISKFKNYGKLSRRTALQAEDAVSRIDESINKRNKGDFNLWKFSKPGEPVWPSPLGAGRPGWHIEDTAITEHFFGQEYDIHGGGGDLKFPHHEAEIAQQEASSGKKYSKGKSFVKIWMHTGMLTVNGKKMSKSLGNFITIRDFLKNHSPEVLRLMVLGHHYRMPMDYNEGLIKQAKKNFDDISRFLGKIDFRLDYLKNNPIDIGPSKNLIYAYPAIFKNALANDLNTPAAVSAIFLTVTKSERGLRLITKKNLEETKDFLNKSLHLLGLTPKKPKIPLKIKQLVARREKFRRNEQFSQSDALRKKILGLGYTIEDTASGPFIWPKNQK